jgi:hypothetical protein
MSDWDNLVEPTRGALEALLRKGDKMANRIEELEAKLAKLAKAAGRVHDSYWYSSDRIILGMYDLTDALREARTTLAELKGQGRGPWPNAIRAVNYRIGMKKDGSPVWAHRLEQYHDGRWTAIRVFNESEDGTLEEEDQ